MEIIYFTYTPIQCIRISLPTYLPTPTYLPDVSARNTPPYPIAHRATKPNRINNHIENIIALSVEKITIMSKKRRNSNIKNMYQYQQYNAQLIDDNQE